MIAIDHRKVIREVEGIDESNPALPPFYLHHRQSLQFFDDSCELFFLIQTLLSKFT